MRSLKALLLSVALALGGVALQGLVDPQQVTQAQSWTNVRTFGAKCDGTTDDTTAFQNTINAAQATGGSGVVYVPPGNPRCLNSSGLTIDVTKGPVAFLGAQKWASVIRYTGTGTWLSPTGTGNIQVTLADFSLQLTGANAVGVNMAQFISSTVKSVRIASSAGSPNGTTGLSANITNAAWTSFYNVVFDLTCDTLATCILLDSSVGNQPNRWRIIALTMLGGTNGVIHNSVKGTDEVVPYFDQITGTGLTYGASADRNSVFGARMESAAGGTLYSFNATANRSEVFGTQIHAGAFGTSALGTRTQYMGAWDEGVLWSGSSATAPLGIDRSADGNGQINFPLLVTTGSSANQIRTAQSTAPTCSNNCGTSSSVVGTDTAMVVTMGSGGSPASPFTVSFFASWAAAPSCIAVAAKTGMATGKKPILVVPGTGSVVITTDGTAPGNSDVYNISCFGVQ